MAVDKLLILQNVAASLAYITVANGYRTTVETVESTVRVWGEVETTQMPWLGFGATETRPDPFLPGDQVLPKMSISVVAHIHETTTATAMATICGLEDDIMHVMCSSAIDANTGVSFSQRGYASPQPNAIQTIWVRTLDNVADPTISEDGGVCMVMEFEIQWERTSSRSPS